MCSLPWRRAWRVWAVKIYSRNVFSRTDAYVSPKSGIYINESATVNEPDIVLGRGKYEMMIIFLCYYRANCKVYVIPVNTGNPHIKEIDSRLLGNDSLNANCSSSIKKLPGFFT